MFQKIICSFFILILFSITCIAKTDDDVVSKPSLIYGALMKSIVPGLTRPLIALPFEVIIIGKQVTEKPYKEIFSELLTQKDAAKKFFKIFKVSALELWMKGSVYTIYGYSTAKTKEVMPDLSIRYPAIPEIAAVTMIAANEVFYVNWMERMKVCYYKDIPIPFLENDKIKWSECFKNRKWFFTGGTLTFQSTFLHVGTFLTLNHHLSHLLFNKSGKLTVRESCVMSPVMAMLQTATTYPILTLRAQCHAQRLLTGQDNFSVFSYVKELYRTKKLLGLYNGGATRFARTTLIAMFDTYWINSLKKD